MTEYINNNEIDLSALASFFAPKSKEETINDSIHSSLFNILENERGISEKDFSTVDKTLIEVKAIINKHKGIMLSGVEKQQRPAYIAEQIYDAEFNTFVVKGTLSIDAPKDSEETQDEKIKLST
jgi:hypothetical protein